MDFLKCFWSRMRRRAGGTKLFQACVSLGTKLFRQYSGLRVAGANRAGGKRVLAETLLPSGIGAGASEWSGGGEPFVQQAVHRAESCNSTSVAQGVELAALLVAAVALRGMATCPRQREGVHP